MRTQLMVEYERQTGSPFTDSLTGLFNHGFFRTSLDREAKRAERHGETFAVALIDVDSFSHYNQRHGSLQGDRALKEISGLIIENIRQADLAARYSGDVFAAILTKSDSHTASVAMERIRQAVETRSDTLPTVSIGLASYPNDGTDDASLIALAQEALSKAKVSGKNRAYFFERKRELIPDSLPTVLVVDDEARNVKLLEALLRPLNYEVIKASDGKQAMSIINKMDVDLVLLDIMMPEMDGYEVCRRLKGSEATRLIPVVMVTALDDLESKVKGIEAGADDFLTKPPQKLELVARTKSLIKYKRLNNNLASIEHVLFSLANAVEAKDPYTHGHVERVSNLAVSLGKRMGLSTKKLEALRYGGALHDIGKIAVSSEIINKSGPLDPEEWEIMKTHPDVGCKICEPLTKNLGAALDIIRHHHEKLDGSGYPDGLKAEDISAVARIMAVVDIYDALVTDRPYRKGMEKEKALGILREEAGGGKLDIQVVEYLIHMVEA